MSSLVLSTIGRMDENGHILLEASKQPKTELDTMLTNGENSDGGGHHHQQPRVITEADSGHMMNGNGPVGPGLQRVVLEDIRLEEYYNETMEESLCKQFKFQITNSELKVMIENSVLETSTPKPYRYLTGNFIRVFERHVEVFEKQKIPIQKRNNIVYEESLRNNTVYLRVNGDCKLCPKANRVKYVFTIKQKPEPDDKYVEVEAKIRGTHQHDSLNGSFNGSMNESQLNTTGGGGSSQQMTSSGTRKRQSMNMSNGDLSANSTPDKMMLVNKKKKFNQKNGTAASNDFANSIDNSISSVTAAYLSTSPMNGGNATNNRSAVHSNTSTSSNSNTNNSNSNTMNVISLSDKNVINQIVNQVSSKIMIKLDQINLKVNQISDRLYDLERKLDSVEVAEIQF